GGGCGPERWAPAWTSPASPRGLDGRLRYPLPCWRGGGNDGWRRPHRLREGAAPRGGQDPASAVARRGRGGRAVPRDRGGGDPADRAAPRRLRAALLLRSSR